MPAATSPYFYTIPRILSIFESNVPNLAVLSIKAIEAGLDRLGFTILYRTNSLHLEQVNHNPVQYIQYYERLIDILIRAAGFDEGTFNEPDSSSNSVNLQKIALEILPDSLSNCFWLTHSKKVLEQLLDFSQRVISGQVPIQRTKVIITLRAAMILCTPVNKLDRYISTIQTSLSLLDQGSYLDRLKRWCGEWTTERGNKLDSEINKLAIEATNNPEILNTEAFNWLCSTDAKKSPNFFQSLGRIDTAGVWVNNISNLGRKQEGIGAFSYYWGGLAQVNVITASLQLDTLINSDDQILPGSIIGATYYLGANAAAISRIEKQIEKDNDVKFTVINSLCNGFWLRSFNYNDFSRFLSVIAIPVEQYPDAMAYICNEWLQTNTDNVLEGELNNLAWKALEKVNYNYAQIADELASKLTHNNPDKGFSLLSKLLHSQFGYTFWNPLSTALSGDFYHSLFKFDPKRTLQTILDTTLASDSSAGTILFYFSDKLDQEENATIISFSHESVENARFIAKGLNGRKKGFWQIVFSLLEKYPHDKELRETLEAAVIRKQPAIWGQESTDLEQGLINVKNARSDVNTPKELYGWLDGVINVLHP